MAGQPCFLPMPQLSPNLAEPHQAITLGKFPIQAVICVEIDAHETIVAPSYLFFPIRRKKHKSEAPCVPMV